MRDFEHRHAHLIMRTISIHLQLAGAHADHVRRYRQAKGEEPPEMSHASDRGATSSAARPRRRRTKSTRSVASIGTEKNIPAIPPIRSPANTPTSTSTGLSSTPRPMTYGEIT